MCSAGTTVGASRSLLHLPAPTGRNSPIANKHTPLPSASICFRPIFPRYAQCRREPSRNILTLPSANVCSRNCRWSENVVSVSIRKLSNDAHHWRCCPVRSMEKPFFDWLNRLFRSDNHPSNWSVSPFHHPRAGGSGRYPHFP